MSEMSYVQRRVLAGALAMVAIAVSTVLALRAGDAGSTGSTSPMYQSAKWGS